MKKLYIALVVVVVLVGAALTFKLFINQPVEDGDLAAGQKIYRNDVYGLEFKYPSEWQPCTQNMLKIFSSDYENEYYEISMLCIYNPSSMSNDDNPINLPQIISFYINKSGRYGDTFESLRQHFLPDYENPGRPDDGGMKIFHEKELGGRNYINSGFGDFGTRGLYITLLDAKTYLVARYLNNEPDYVVEDILSSLKTD